MIALVFAFNLNLLQMLALYKPYQKFLETEVGIDILRPVATAANPDQFVDDIRYLRVIFEMIFIEAQLPIMRLLLLVIVSVKILQRVIYISCINCKSYNLGDRSRYTFSYCFQFFDGDDRFKPGCFSNE